MLIHGRGAASRGWHRGLALDETLLDKKAGPGDL